MLLLHYHAAFSEQEDIARFDTEIDAKKATLEVQQARLRDIEAQAQLVRQEIVITRRELEFLENSRTASTHKLRLEPVLLAPNSDFPQYADFIYVGLLAVFCAPTCGSSGNFSCGGDHADGARGCEEIRLHVLEKRPSISAATAAAASLASMGRAADLDENTTSDLVHFSLELWLEDEPGGAFSISQFDVQLCVVAPEPRHAHYHAAMHVVGNFRCQDEVFDPDRPWSSVHKMPFHDFRQRMADHYMGQFFVAVHGRVQAHSFFAPLLGGTVSRHNLYCSILAEPNLCDHESMVLDRLSSPLFPSTENSSSWDFNAPASCAAATCSSPQTSCPCHVHIVWTFWSRPPPYEMDWLSELADLSGCSVTHWRDLQLRCRGSVFADAADVPGRRAHSKVFVVSYFSKDYTRGFGAMESCMIMWKLDGFSAALVHFGDDGNIYSYLRYPRLDFVLRNHPRNETFDLETFANVVPLGLGYKIGFWPPHLRNITARQVCCEHITARFKTRALVLSRLVAQESICRRVGCIKPLILCLVRRTTVGKIAESGGMAAGCR